MLNNFELSYVFVLLIFIFFIFFVFRIGTFDALLGSESNQIVKIHI